MNISTAARFNGLVENAGTHLKSRVPSAWLYLQVAAQAIESLTPRRHTGAASPLSTAHNKTIYNRSQR
jgi:hypothetical protein